MLEFLGEIILMPRLNDLEEMKSLPANDSLKITENWIKPVFDDKPIVCWIYFGKHKHVHFLSFLKTGTDQLVLIRSIWKEGPSPRAANAMAADALAMQGAIFCIGLMCLVYLE